MFLKYIYLFIYLFYINTISCTSPSSTVTELDAEEALLDRGEALGALSSMENIELSQY